jgi:putative peptidoglycan lipid II flippase
MLPYMVLICGVALLAGAQNVVGRFGHPAAMPILFNLVLISGVIAGSYWAHDDVQHVNILAGAVLFAGATQLALSWWALRKADFRPRLVWNPLHPDIKRIVSSMLPMMLGLGVVQINVLADRIVALVFVDEGGGVAALSYAERLYQLPLGLFGVALATAIFPQLSRFAADNDQAGFSETLARGLRLALFVGIPASVGLWAVREPAVTVIYQHGRLDPESALRVAKVVGFYGMGVWAYIFQQVILRAYYAQHHTKTPVRVASRMVLLNICLNLLLVQWLAEAGIALATAVTAALQVAILGRLFPRTGRSIAWRSVLDCGARVAAASALMYLAIATVDRAIGQWGEGFSGAALRLGVLMAMGITVFAIAAKILLPEELRFIRHAFTSREEPKGRD